MRYTEILDLIAKFLKWEIEVEFLHFEIQKKKLNILHLYNHVKLDKLYSYLSCFRHLIVSSKPIIIKK